MSLVVRLAKVAMLSIVVASIAVAHEGHDHPPKKVQPAEFYRPTAIPDRIVLTWAGDPRNSQSVTWRTSTEITTALAEIAVADGSPHFFKTATKVAAKTEPLKTDINEAHFHSVTFADLKPGTRYGYRVGDGVNWSEWFHFSTASEKPEPFSFIYFGDAQNDIRSMWSRVIREAFTDAPKAKFLVHAGDLINTAESDAEWGEWFGAGNWLNAMIPSVAVPGNHEQAKNQDGTRRLSHHWRKQFTQLENGPAGFEEVCFTLVYGNTRIIGLDSNNGLEEQARWMEQVLTDNKCEWVVCTFHHPIFSTGNDRDNPKLRAVWKPVFDKFKVDLVLQGHDHTYGRTGLSTPVEVPETVGNVPTGVTNVDQTTGTIYVVSVSGPKMYNLQPHEFMKRTAEDTQLYQIIHIDGPTLRYESRTAVGELYDAFVLEKQPGQINKITEIEPAVAERRRPAAAGNGEKPAANRDTKAPGTK